MRKGNGMEAPSAPKRHAVSSWDDASGEESWWFPDIAYVHFQPAAEAAAVVCWAAWGCCRFEGGALRTFSWSQTSVSYPNSQRAVCKDWSCWDPTGHQQEDLLPMRGASWRRWLRTPAHFVVVGRPWSGAQASSRWPRKRRREG